MTYTTHFKPIIADLAELEGEINLEMLKTRPAFDMFLWDARSKVRRVKSHMEFENETAKKTIADLQQALKSLDYMDEKTDEARKVLAETIGSQKALMEMR